MRNGSIIALAWPETRCKQAGSWYDPYTSFLGFSKDGYYKVGHAALVVVDHNTGNCQYFDFGRYHSPAGHGRVRSAETDHDLRMTSKAEIDPSNNSIQNIDEILAELFRNSSTHGDGEIFGSVTHVDLDNTLKYILELQNNDHTKYGPFVRSGTNCSRFVCSAMLAGNPNWDVKLGLQFPLTITPTPMWNLRVAQGPMFSYDGLLQPVQEVVLDTISVLDDLLSEEVLLEEVPIPISANG